MSVPGGAALCALAKAEIAEKPLFSRTDKLAFLSGLIFSSGSLIVGHGDVSVTVSVSDGKMAETARAVFESVLGRSATVRGNKRKTLEVGHAAALLQEAGVLTAEDGVLRARSDIDRSFFDSAAAYVRGVFAGSGSMTSKQYHLEFTFGNSGIASDFIKLLEGCNVHGKLAVRAERAVVYVKNGEEICDTLALMGAGRACLQLNALMVERQMAEHLNRQRNCDLHNIDKQTEAGVRQATKLKALPLDGLTEPLRQTALARIEHPDSSYEELSEMLGISKSGLKNRLRRLEALCAATEA